MIVHVPIHPGDRVGDADVSYIYQGLCSCALPKEYWTHGAHLCAGVAMLQASGLFRAEMTMPDVIRRYNVSVGGVNSDTEGYHETLTILYLRLLNKALFGRFEKSLGVLATEILATPLADRAFPMNYYSKDVLFSSEARREWVAPDLKPF